MKKKAIVAFAVVLLTMLGAIQTKAQYLPSSLESSRGYLVDQNGNKLSDQEVLLAVGEEIYHDTYVGASKQYRIGHKLLKGGIVGVCVGTGITLGSAILVATGTSTYREYWKYGPDSQGQPNQVTEMDGRGVVGIVGMAAGITVMTLGAVALEAGIPFMCIGGKRLNWVAENYNENQRSRDVSLRFGTGRYGTGLVLTF